MGEDVKKASMSGMNGHLAKPVSIELLRGGLSGCLDCKRMNRWDEMMEISLSTAANASEVDGVTGATMSSRAVKKNVAAAVGRVLVSAVAGVQYRHAAGEFGRQARGAYRKALRLMKQAETFNRPVVCFVDTPGAFCGLEAEERGQGEAIARNLFEISDLKVPVLSIVIGEGGSGGALAMAVADEVWMLENAIYSILSPEGFASILYKDSKKAPDAAKVMKVTAKDLLQLKLIERIVPEEEPACTDNLYRLAEYMDSAMAEFFKTYLAMSDEELREHRYQRFRRM